VNREEPLQVALDSRKFEIELYWKRATYFWTLLAAALAGYFALASSPKEDRDPFLLFLISGIGLVLAVAWWLVSAQNCVYCGLQ
jgi:lipopolysaccharide export LptBFGC system permease protein LptF